MNVRELMINNIIDIKGKTTRTYDVYKPHRITIGIMNNIHKYAIAPKIEISDISAVYVNPIIDPMYYGQTEMKDAISSTITREGGSNAIWPIYKPIQLTEDWLLRCGFNILPYEGNPNDGKIAQLKSFTLDKGLNWEHWVYIHTGEYYDSNPVWREIKYVHQLQNLYIAITGEELDVSL